MFISAEKGNYPITVLCRVLHVSRSAYNRWTCRKTPTAHERSDEALRVEIHAIFKVGRGSYGSPRVHEKLKRNGHRVSRKRVERLMRESGLFSRRKRKFKCTTDSNHKLPIAPNDLDRKFEAIQPNTKWVTDVTYVWTLEGWLYLAAIVDLCSRKVVGWSMSDSLATPLVTRALGMALRLRRPDQGLLHHSDRGCQYASREYQLMLKAHGIQCSMSRKGNCWDNAVAESFFATLKTELVHHVVFKTRTEARTAIFDFIEIFYNRQRIHSSIGYVTPEEFEFNWNQQKEAA